jgi:hypothetical protein
MNRIRGSYSVAKRSACVRSAYMDAERGAALEGRPVGARCTRANTPCQRLATRLVICPKPILPCEIPGALTRISRRCHSEVAMARAERQGSGPCWQNLLLKRVALKGRRLRGARPASSEAARAPVNDDGHGTHPTGGTSHPEHADALVRFGQIAQGLAVAPGSLAACPGRFNGSKSPLAR